MTKTLKVSIDDVEKINGLSISGTRKDEFNPDVVLEVGSLKVVLNSKELAEALATVVDFVTPPQTNTEKLNQEIQQGSNQISGLINLEDIR